MANCTVLFGLLMMVKLYVSLLLIVSQTKLSLAAVFDACLLCGDQGYVMEGNQVVCVGCGVHMFIPSIGKPGGCNPVPIKIGNKLRLKFSLIEPAWKKG